MSNIVLLFVKAGCFLGTSHNLPKRGMNTKTPDRPLGGQRVIPYIPKPICPLNQRVGIDSRSPGYRF